MTRWEKINNSIVSFFDVFDGSKGWQLLLLFCCIQWIFSFINTEYVSTDELFDDYLEERRKEKYDDYDEIASEFEDDLDDFEDEEQYYWSDQLWDFVILFILNIIWFSATASALHVGLSLSEKTDKITFNSIFKIVVLSEMVFFIPVIFKILWFGFVDTEYDFQEIRNFHPYSLLGLFGAENVQEWLIYPLRTLNIFEVIFVYFMIVGVANKTSLSKEIISNPIISSYGLLLFVWITFRVYISSLI